MTWARLRLSAWWALVGVSAGALVAGAAGGVLVSGDAMGPLMAACLVVGALVARRRPENPIGWVFLGAAAVAGLDVVAGLLARSVTSNSASPSWAVTALWAYRWLWLVLVWLLTAVTFLLFPDGLPSARWRPVLWLSVGVAAVLTVGLATAPTLTALDGSAVDNPFGVDISIGEAGTALILMLALGVIALSLLSLVLRARQAVGVERLQLRWFVFACVVFVIVGVLQTAVPALSTGLPGQLLFMAAATFVPIACGIAVMRYRLYDIDRVVSRTASYAIVTALLALTYVVIVTSVSRLVGSQSSLVVAAATLAAAALFRPLLTRVQRVVDRRFNREKVDGLSAVEEFGGRLTDQVDPDRTLTELVAVSRRTLAPQTVSVWIRRE